MKLPIPSAALAQHIIALGKTRAGKSSKVRVLVEALLDEEKPVCILDPKGDWWGLKSSADGKRAGYPIVVFGGEHADVALNEHAGAAVAELVATGNRPALIDLGGWTIGARTRFFVDFAGAFFKLTRGPRFLVIDEVHNFAPQGRVMDPDSAKMLHWANRLASEGSGKGVTLIAASQRPQKVHKDFVTSCETLIACRVIHRLDRDAIGDWIDGCADAAKGKEVLRELATMKREEAWVWSPEIEFGPQRITWPMFKTFDSFKPQGAQAEKLTGWAAVDLEDVRGKLAAVIEEAEASDPRTLRKRIADLERQAANGVGAAANDGYDRGYTDGEQQGFQRALKVHHEARRTLISSLRSDLAGELQVFGHVIEKLLQSKQTTEPVVTVHPPVGRMKPATRRAVEEVAKAAIANVARENGVGEQLPPVQQRVLNALAELIELGASNPDRELVAFLADYTNLRSKGFTNALGALSSAKLIAYPSSDTVQLTDAGRFLARATERPRSSQELQDRICRMLGGASEKILRPLITAGGRPIERDKLGEMSGYTNERSKGFANALGRLRSLGFIDYPERGMVAAQPILFLEQR